MKTPFFPKLVLLSLLFFGFMACSNARVATTGEVYSNEQIEQMLNLRNLSLRDVNPPPALQQRLLADFPGARDIEWETNGTVFEAEFEIARIDHKAYYDAQGNLLMYIVEISATQVSSKVKSAVRAQFSGHRIDDARRIVLGLETLYELELERGEVEFYAIFRADGSFVK